MRASPRLKNFPFQSFRVLLVLFLLPSEGWAGNGAPLMVRSESVGQLFRINPPIFGVFETSEAFEFQVSRTYANLWAQDKRFLIDAEVIDDRAHILMQPLRFLKLGLGFASRRFARTRTDQIAISFHDLFRIGQDGRLEAGKHKTHYTIPDYSLEYSPADLNRPISEQFNADITVPLFGDDDQGWSMSGTLMGSYETAETSPYYANAVDRGLQLNLRYPFSYGAAYASLTQLYFEGRQPVDVATVRQQLGWAVGAVHALLPRQEILAQLMVYQPVFRQLGQLSRNSYEVQLGYRLRFDNIALEATLIENIFWLYNSPDWGFSLGMRASLH